MNTTIIRKATTGEPGNRGEFGTHEHGDPEAELTDYAPEEPADFEPEQYIPTYTLPAGRLAEAVTRIEKANQKLERAGIPDRFTYEAVFSVRTELGKSPVELVKLTLSQPSISFNGWEFTGAHEITPDGAIVHHGGGRGVIDMHCDHCGMNRRREKVYSIHSDTEGDKQVGKSCLEAFLGVRPEGLWALGDDLELDELEDDGDEWNGPSGGPSIYPADDLLVAALAASDDGDKFISRSAAAFDEKPTANVVLDTFDELLENVPAKRRKLAKQIKAWVAKQEPGSSDYIENLQAVLVGGDHGGKWVRAKHVALAVSAVGSYKASLRREAERQRRAARKAQEAREYLAPPDTKLKALTATVEHVAYSEGYYGTTSIIKMMDDDGHILTWFASGEKEYKDGTRVTIDRATVKANEMYKDSFQTILTRAKLTPLEDAGK